MDPNAPAPAAPDAGGGAPAQPAAPAPAPAPAAPADNQPTPAEQAESTEANEWDSAVDELFPGIRTTTKKQEANKNEPADPNATTQTTQAPAEGAEGQDPPKPGGEGEDENGEQDEGEAEAPDLTGRDARLAQREYQQQVDTVKADVRSKLFADMPQTLQDADGDPIRDITDVMKLINPRTVTEENPQGRTFNEEEAGMWLLSAQQKFNENMSNIEKRVEQIAETNVDLGEQADVIKYKYGELLKVLPDPDNPKKLYRDTLWEDYQNTLKKDPKSNVIVEAPVSLERFYERALAPYARMAREAEQKNNENQPAQPAQPAPDPNANRHQVRNDRSDIFGGTNNDNPNPEDKEWAEAATAVFGPRKA